jgi:hypothetical protein
VVPVKNGSTPAPGGGHSTQFGTPLEVAAEAVPDEAPALAGEDLVDPTAPTALDPAPMPVEDAPAVDPVAAAAVGADDVDCAEAAGFVAAAPIAAELSAAPRLTTPRCVMAPCGAMVCAAVGSANAIPSSAA